LELVALSTSGTYSIVCRERDGTDVGNYQLNLLLFGAGANQAPMLTAIPDQTVAEFSEIRIAASASDPDPGQMLTYSIDSDFPAGLAINPSTGLISWTPGEAQGPGTYPLTVRVTDSGTPPLSATASFVINVSEVNEPPVITGVTAPSEVRAGELLGITVAASDVDLPIQSLTYVLTGYAVPPNMDGRFNFRVMPNPGGPERYSLVLKARVTDSLGAGSAEREFSIVVNDPRNTPPTISAIPDQQTDMDRSTTRVPFTVGDAETAPASLLVRAASSNPQVVADDGIHIEGNGASRTILVTPAPGATGSAEITVTVTDAGGLAAEEKFTVKVCPCLEPDLEIDLYAVLTIRGLVDQGYQIEYTTDASEPRTWQPLATIVLQQSPQLFIDVSGPAAGRRFYRAKVASPGPAPASAFEHLQALRLAPE
jgi:hypothetical protein